MRMNRIDRLFAILLMLQDSQRVTAQQLATRFGTSERTIYRDIRALMAMGIPIVPLPGEGYELMHTFRLPPVMLSPEEAQALFMAGRMFLRQSTGRVATHTQTALVKLKSALPSRLHDLLEQYSRMIDFYSADNPLDWDEPHLLTLLDAIENNTSLQIRYRSYQRYAITTRMIAPYRLVFGKGAWYVQAYCHLRNDLRDFRLSRMQDVAITEQRFSKRQFVPYPKEVIAVKVRFSAHIVTHVRERQHYAFVREDETGLMHYEVETLNEIQHWLLGFGASMQVLEPESLRAWLREEAQSLINSLT
jgi:predicted DNA-binding transcriptional regulator YafY